jgi:hypothetical protein
MKWYKLQPTCLICNEIGPYYYVTKEKSKSIPPKLKQDEHFADLIIWLEKHKHNNKTSMSYKYVEEDEYLADDNNEWVIDEE